MEIRHQSDGVDYIGEVINFSNNMLIECMKVLLFTGEIHYFPD